MISPESYKIIVTPFQIPFLVQVMEQGTRARETEKRVCRWKLAERHKRVTSHWVLNPLRIWALLMTNSLLWSSISDWNKTSSNWITDFFVFLILTFLWLSFNNGQLYLKSPALDLFRKKKRKKDTGRPEYLTIIPHAGSGYLYWLQNFFRAHWLISLSISWHTYEFMTQRVRVNNLIICYCKKNNQKGVFHASVLLLTMNFAVTALPK